MSGSYLLLHVGLARETAAMTSRVVVALLAWSVICGTVVQATKDFDFFYFVQQVRAPCLALNPFFLSCRTSLYVGIDDLFL